MPDNTPEKALGKQYGIEVPGSATSKASDQHSIAGTLRQSAEKRGERIPLEGPTQIQAWSQAFLSHLINFNSFGYILSFGIFQTYYREQLGFSPSDTSWIGTTQLFLLFFIGVFSGRALDAGYYRYTLMAGVTCQLLAVFATSFCTRYYQLFLAQGICQGIGNGLLFCPAVALVSTYFLQQKRALALSAVACGGATGGMVFPAIARSLLGRIGFPWTVRVMGFVMLSTSAIIVPFSKARPNHSQRGGSSFLGPTAKRDLPYLLFCIGIFLAFWGIYFAYYYVGAFARDVLHVSQDTSLILILIINSFGIPGRVIPNFLADRFFGALNLEVPFILISGVLLLAWIAVKSVAGFYVWVAVYGFVAGGSQSLFQAASSSFSNDPDKIGVRIGMVCTVASFACLSGPPIAGRLLEVMNGRYLAAQLFGGIVMVLGSIFLLAARLVQTRHHNQHGNRINLP